MVRPKKRRKARNASLAGMIARLETFEKTSFFEGNVDWYVRAKLGVALLARATGHGFATVANVLAVTSPQCNVAQNVEIAYAILTGGKARGLGANIAKGLEIVRDPRSARVMVSGPKVEPFAKSLKGKADLVLDVHALRAVGLQQGSISTIEWARAEKAYRSRASALGLRIEAYQAGIWEAARVLLGNGGAKREGCLLRAVQKTLGF